MLKGQYADRKPEMGKLLCIWYFMEGYKNSILPFYLTQESFPLDVMDPLSSFFPKIVSLLTRFSAHISHCAALV